MHQPRGSRYTLAEIILGRGLRTNRTESDRPDLTLFLLHLGIVGAVRPTRLLYGLNQILHLRDVRIVFHHGFFVFPGDLGRNSVTDFEFGFVGTAFNCVACRFALSHQAGKDFGSYLGSP